MQGRAEGVWGAMGGGTKTMVGVVLPWKSMTNGGLDPIKPLPKKWVTFSVSVVDLSFILSTCDPKCQALQLIFHCCHPDTLATGMDLTQWSYTNDQPAGCVLKSHYMSIVILDYMICYKSIWLSNGWGTAFLHVLFELHSAPQNPL